MLSFDIKAFIYWMDKLFGDNHIFLEITCRFRTNAKSKFLIRGKIVTLTFFTFAQRTDPHHPMMTLIKQMSFCELGILIILFFYIGKYELVVTRILFSFFVLYVRLRPRSLVFKCLLSTVTCQKMLKYGLFTAC